MARAKPAGKGKKAAKPVAEKRPPAASVHIGAKPRRNSQTQSQTGAAQADLRRQSPQSRALSKQGLRRYAQYRDLGIAAATNGLARAHVIKMIPPCDPAEVSKRHYHDVEFQMVYVLKGWIKGEYEGEGIVTMREGSCWLQPPKIKHTVLDYSDDCELLEVILPADFETVELE